MQIHFNQLSNDELRQLFTLTTTTGEGHRLSQSASSEWWQRRDNPVIRGRWPTLVWFTQTERIMSRDEFAAALGRRRRRR